MLTIGVEEEYFVVDPRSGELAAAGLPSFDRLIASGLDGSAVAGFDTEFQLPIVESRTGVCSTLAELQRDLIRLRQRLVENAQAAGLAIAASGTLPTSDWRQVGLVDKPRYNQIADRYRDVVSRRLTCGYHVHIGIDDPDLAVQVINRVQPWLPTLLALSASSPMFVRRDTGYASYRHTLWGAFPVAGPTPRFETHKQYMQYIEMLVGIGALNDAGNVFWDVRLGTRFPTIEFRIADMSPDVDGAVLYAALYRALVLTCLREATDGKPEIDADFGLLRAATWHAARWGMSGMLVDTVNRVVRPAAEVVDALLHHVRDALEDCKDHELVAALAQAAQADNAALHQQAIYKSTGSLAKVTEWIVATTSAATPW